MPSYTRGEKRDNLTFVELNAVGSNVFYAWYAKDIASETNVTSADLTALGHRQAASLPAGALYLIAASSPKPGRATKKIVDNPGVTQKGTVSTFYAVGSVSSMLSQGWKLTKRPSIVSLSNNARFVTAIAELSNGLSYCFPLNRADFDTYGAQLGLTTSATINTDAERNRLVAGCSFPRPGRASLDLGNGADFSSFFSSNSISELQQAGYKILYPELIDG
jgi:hypothetical protein